MVANHDDYIASAPEELRPLLIHVRSLLVQVLPDAEEVIAYNMPGFTMDQTVIVGYGAFSKQCGIYVTPSVIVSHADEIAAAGLKSTKTGVTFSPKKPIPGELVKKLARAAKAAHAG